jgi:hypothetical protein
MIPDPSTAEGAPLVEDGPDRPARDTRHDPASRAGHLCVVCGQPIAADLWDMTIFAGPDRVAYLTCLFELMGPT